MIQEVSASNLLSFNEVRFEPCPGLNLFSGPSGAGKSLLLGVMLALLGLGESEAARAEMILEPTVDLSAIGMEGDDEVIVRMSAHPKKRFFINDQSVARKSLATLFTPHVRYLSHRSAEELSAPKLCALLDAFVSRDDPEHAKQLEAYMQAWARWQKSERELADLSAKEGELEELREFTRFECEKIRRINPKEGEEEELLALRKKVVQVEKLSRLIERSEGVLAFEERLYALYDYFGRSDELVRGAMEEIRDLLAQASAELETLESVDIDALMRRLDELSALSKRYGSVSEALNYLAQKEKELARYESFDLEIKRLEREVSEAKEEALAYAALLSEARHRVAMKLSDLLTQLLRELILPEAKVEVHETALGPMGYDEVVMMIGATELSKLSSGEFSRVRLAILAAWLEVGLDERGVLFLDEVDANLSGDESMSVGRILRRLARHYQIFAISHQPQMTSLAERHFLVIKEDGVSRVRQIEGEERVAEIARIISHGTITPQALAYARSMLEANKEIA